MMPTEIICRQGDVLVFRLPESISHGEPIERENKKIVLAYGEATGHAHVIGARGATLYRLRDNEDGSDSGLLSTDRILEVVAKSGIELRHEKHGRLTGEHGTAKIPPGKFGVRIQRQWHESGDRQVID